MKEKDKVFSSAKAVYDEKEQVFSAVFSREIVDRDGEIVMIDGIDLTNFQKNPVLIDSHKMYSSVTEILGSVKNLKKEEVDGKKCLVGEIEFADHPKAHYAKQMVIDGHLRAFSIQYKILDFDKEKKHITECELWEISAVAIPANPEALMKKGVKISKTAKTFKTVDDLENASEIYKQIKLYEEYKPKMKSYREYVNKKMTKLLGIEVSDDELTNLKNVYEAIESTFSANPIKKKSANQTEYKTLSLADFKSKYIK